MGGQLDPAVARARLLVRAGLADVATGDLVLVGLSGGADSLALTAVTAFVAPRAGLRWGVVVVDHGLQPGSDLVAATAAGQAADLGADPVRVVRVDVASDTGMGPEAAARDVRHRALHAEAAGLCAAAVLLAHTRDDQAETVLLGLARGSGPRSMAGMRPETGLVRRPFLDLARADTVAVCAAEGLTPWHDPHNENRAYLRTRVRQNVLPVLEEQLGPGVAAGLARTARLLRDDTDLLDHLALDLFTAVSCPQPQAPQGGSGAVGVSVAGLEAAAPALSRRVLRLAALAAGAPGTDLSATHVEAVHRLLTDWHGQGRLDLPGGVGVQRIGGTLRFGRSV